jgi:hypothetical protein
VLTTEAASADEIADVDLVVVGAPVLGFSLATDQMRVRVAMSEADAPIPPDLAHPSLRSWLDSLPAGRGNAAAFETRMWWSPRGATGDIEKRLKNSGYRLVAKAHKFVVKDTYGPLREGEVERARQWGRELAQAVAG